MNDQIIKPSEKILTAGAVVHDVESGENIEITNDMLAQAQQVQGVLTSGFMLMASALCRMKNHRLYLVFGFESFKDYCTEALPFSARNAYRYALLGEKVQNVLGDDLPAEEVGALGLCKLKLLAQKVEPEFERLLTEGRVVLGDDEYSADDLRQQSVKALKEKLDSMTSKASKAQILEEKNNSLRLELDVLKKEAEELRHFKSEYEPSVQNDLQNQVKLDEAWKLMESSLTRIAQLQPSMMKEGTQSRLLSFFNALDQRVTDLKTRKDFHELLMELNAL